MPNIEVCGVETLRFSRDLDLVTGRLAGRSTESGLERQLRVSSTLGAHGGLQDLNFPRFHGMHDPPGHCHGHGYGQWV